jgi:hypothetical protein
VAAVQATELSASRRAARRAYDTALGWYAGCSDPRVQLLSTQRVDGVGDEAMMLVLRAWGQPTWSYVAGVARSGRLTTTTFTRSTATAPADLGRSVRLLGTAVQGMCGQPHAGACVTRPRVRPVAPLPVGRVPGMLDAVDLPPIVGVPKPWVGTEPRRAMDNDASTSCDDADFRSAPMSNNVTRTFVIPGSRLPAQFGITETVGTMPARRAKAFVERIRTRMAACPDEDLGTDVTRVAHRAGAARDLSVWLVRTELSEDRTVSFLMGIVREGTAIGQVGFVPDARVTMPRPAFVALLERAAARLPAMPRPR